MLLPTFNQIVEILQASSYVKTGLWLNLGFNQAKLPLYTLVPLVKLFGTDYRLVFVFNYALISLGVILLVSALKPKSKIAFGYLTLLFLVSPWVWQTVYSSTAIALLILGFGLLIRLNNHPKLFWFFFIFLSLMVIPYNQLPFLNFHSWDFYVNQHRQADLYVHQSLIARLLYNRYVYTIRTLFLHFLGFFDWDKWAFVGSSGKAEASPFTAMQLTLWEIPLVWLSLKKYVGKYRKILIVFLLITLYQAACDTTQNQAVFWMFLDFWIALWLSSYKFRLKSKFGLLVCLILFTKILLLNYTLINQNQHKEIFNAYQEITNTLSQKQFKDKNVLITDRLGQPHVYLTYFGLIDIANLQQALATTTTRDRLGYLQPFQIDHFKFASFIYDSNNDLVKNKPDNLFIEVSTNFIGIDGSRNAGNVWDLHTPVTIKVNQKDKIEHLTLLHQL